MGSVTLLSEVFVLNMKRLNIYFPSYRPLCRVTFLRAVSLNDVSVQFLQFITYFINIYRLKEEEALANENNNDIHDLSSSQYSENSSGITITSTMGEGRVQTITLAVF